jgi:hypothetical protein
LLFADSRENSAKLKRSNTTCRLGGIKLSISAWILCKTFLFPLLFRLTFFKEENYKPRSWICVQYFSFFCVFSCVFTVCKTKNFKNNSMNCLFLTYFPFVFSSDLQFANKENYKTRAWIVCRLISLCLLLGLYRFLQRRKLENKSTNCLQAYYFSFVFSFWFYMFLQRRKLENKSMNCLQTYYFSLSSPSDFTDICKRRKIQNKRMKLLCALTHSPCLSSSSDLQFRNRKNYKKRDHEFVCKTCFFFIWLFSVFCRKENYTHTRGSTALYKTINR